jgi:hypothetical protein
MRTHPSISLHPPSSNYVTLSGKENIGHIRGVTEAKEKGMAEIDYQASDWHLRRQNTSEQHSTPEDQLGSPAQLTSYARSLSSARSLGSSANSSTRASAMHDMQRIHGNCAVQRSVQRTSTQTDDNAKRAHAHAGLAVQREPTLQDLDQRVKNARSGVLDAEGDLNAIYAVPAAGNVVAAAASLLNLGTAGVSSISTLFGGDEINERVTDDNLTNAGRHALLAVPFLGNYLAGRDASRDWDGSEAALTAPPDQLPEASFKRYKQQSLWDYITD